MSEIPIKINADIKDIKDILISIYHKWSSVKGLFCSLIILNLCLCIFCIIRNWTLWQISFPSLNVLLLILWFILFHIPRTPKNKIGFFVAINVESPEKGDTFRSDFINSIQKSLNLGNTGDHIHFRILPDYISAKILRIEDAEKISHKYRANFILYGSVRIRLINKIETSVLDLNGVVTHKPISQHIQTKFAQEFTELLPQRIFIDKENDILKYEFTAHWVDLVSKYIIGLSFYLSGLTNRALILYHEVYALLNAERTDLPAIIKMRTRMPMRFYEAYSQLANFEYNNWLNKEGSYSLVEFKKCVSKMSELCPNIGPVHLFKAILLFLDSRDIKGTQTELYRCRDIDKAILLCNHAFLDGYVGNLSSARAKYKKAAKQLVQVNTINQIEDFISIILKIEPDKYTLYYCLAWINWCIKGDIKQGKRDFEEFIKKNTEQRYGDEIHISKEFIKQLK